MYQHKKMGKCLLTKKLHFKSSSVKCRPFCHGLNIFLIQGDGEMFGGLIPVSYSAPREKSYGRDSEVKE